MFIINKLQSGEKLETFLYQDNEENEAVDKYVHICQKIKMDWNGTKMTNKEMQKVILDGYMIEETETVCINQVSLEKDTSFIVQVLQDEELSMTLKVNHEKLKEKDFQEAWNKALGRILGSEEHDIQDDATFQAISDLEDAGWKIEQVKVTTVEE